MAKLHFRYGTMGSGKSLDLLKVAYNYEENGMTTLILTSKIDDRYGMDIIKSRTGIHRDAIGVDSKDDIYSIIEYKKSIMNDTISCVLVDEVQFFTVEHTSFSWPKLWTKWESRLYVMDFVLTSKMHHLNRQNI